jgi:hypothetical protein
MHICYSWGWIAFSEGVVGRVSEMAEALKKVTFHLVCGGGPECTVYFEPEGSDVSIEEW